MKARDLINMLQNEYLPDDDVTLVSDIGKVKTIELEYLAKLQAKALKRTLELHAKDYLDSDGRELLIDIECWLEHIS